MRTRAVVFCLWMVAPVSFAVALPLDETPARNGEWGYRPGDGVATEINPPNFSWRPQRDILVWQLQCCRSNDFVAIEYEQDSIDYSVHTPPQTLAPGTWYWRYRGQNADGERTAWSRVRKFTVPKDVPEMPMPGRDDLLSRIPDRHPRLFLRPEQVPNLKDLAAGAMKADYERLVAECEQLLRNPPPTDEPPKYPPGTKSHSESWRKIWWGNRETTIRTLNGAATLAFTRLLGGREEYGQLAKRILLDCARWDPKGATGYRYNDEAGMPYAYYFSRTYTYVHDLLDERERELCRDVMRIRGDEMYRHLCPRHLWTPYSSHSNRAWHFLGEVAIAFHGEIEEADDWAWFAMNVFYNVYPVWSDADGGWHEGISYWSSYVGRFTWWADVMRAAFNVDAYDKPYFRRVGYYPMYLMPPGKVGGGFGDLVAKRTASRNVPLVSVLAAQAGNPHWQWYVTTQGGSRHRDGYTGFLRGTEPEIPSLPPDDLPSSRLFEGTGQATLNTSLVNAKDSVQAVFKSSPFGTQSHGYEANNSFLLWAYGQRLLIRSGYRDIYGSDHHRRWMWSTRSVNNITVDGHGQLSHSAASQGQITRFCTTPEIDLVTGEAGSAYRSSANRDDPSRQLNRFTRTLVFVKPDLLIVYDRLVAHKPATYQYWLHALKQFDVRDQHNIGLQVADVACEIDFLAPENLEFTQTDQYDPNPRERIKLREWHLTATTPEPRDRIEFITLYRPRRGKVIASEHIAELKRIPGGYELLAEVADGHVIAILPADDTVTLESRGLRTKAAVAIQLLDRAGNVRRTLQEE